MVKKLIRLLVLLVISCNFNTAYGDDRVVLSSISSDLWSENIYLIADRKSWVNYENFTVQVGNVGGQIYNFPNWYHGKYEPELYKVDLNNDTLKDIVIILNNDRAPINIPRKDIHILNQAREPYLIYKEASIESVPNIINNYIKIEQSSMVITLNMVDKTYQVDLEKFKYDNPHNPYINVDSLDYNIQDGNLIGKMDVKVIVDNMATGGIIGTLKIKYGWEEEKYKVRDLEFIPLI